MAEINDLSVTAASNTGRFPEGQSIPSINNGAREFEAMTARYHRDRSGFTLSSGTGSAYAIITNGAYPAHATGMVLVWRAHVVSLVNATLAINALATKPLVRQGGGAIQAGDIAANQIVWSLYNAAIDSYQCVGIGGANESNHLGTFTVAGLPTGAAGNTAYASNGRKNGEGIGSGTGVMVFKDGSAWRAADTGATVAA
jgi:hypothetical protein